MNLTPSELDFSVFTCIFCWLFGFLFHRLYANIWWIFTINVLSISIRNWYAVKNIFKDLFSCVCVCVCLRFFHVLFFSIHSIRGLSHSWWPGVIFHNENGSHLLVAYACIRTAIGKRYNLTFDKTPRYIYDPHTCFFISLEIYLHSNAFDTTQTTAIATTRK